MRRGVQLGRDPRDAISYGYLAGGPVALFAVARLMAALVVLSGWLMWAMIALPLMFIAGNHAAAPWTFMIPGPRWVPDGIRTEAKRWRCRASWPQGARLRTARDRRYLVGETFRFAPTPTVN